MGVILHCHFANRWNCTIIISTIIGNVQVLSNTFLRYLFWSFHFGYFHGFMWTNIIILLFYWIIVVHWIHRSLELVTAPLYFNWWNNHVCQSCVSTIYVPCYMTSQLIYIDYILTAQDNFVPSMGHIVKLDLSSNKLTELPETFGNLSLLQHLDLFDNSLTKLPVGFFKVPFFNIWCPGTF